MTPEEQDLPDDVRSLWLRLALGFGLFVLLPRVFQDPVENGVRPWLLSTVLFVGVVALLLREWRRILRERRRSG